MIIINVLQLSGLISRRPTEGFTAMSETIIELDQTEEEMLAYEVCDEVLETAGGVKGGNYTLYYCTALNLCPGP